MGLLGAIAGGLGAIIPMAIPAAVATNPLGAAGIYAGATILGNIFANSAAKNRARRQQQIAEKQLEYQKEQDKIDNALNQQLLAEQQQSRYQTGRIAALNATQRGLDTYARYGVSKTTPSLRIGV